MTKEIDYSGIASTETVAADQWEPPRHIYFGPKDPNTGKMKPEPVYSYQEYPRMLYNEQGDRLVARVVNNDDERDAAIAAGWRKSPADFGVVTAPTLEEVQEQRAGELASQAENDMTVAMLQQAARSVRKPKAA